MPDNESRSVQRRKALQRGEPMPTFVEPTPPSVPTVSGFEKWWMEFSTGESRGDILDMFDLHQQAAVILISRAAHKAGLAAGHEQAAKTICVNCDNGIPLSDGKNKMHLGNLFCYAWAIRALRATPAAPEQT